MAKPGSDEHLSAHMLLARTQGSGPNLTAREAGRCDLHVCPGRGNQTGECTGLNSVLLKFPEPQK